MIKENSNRGNGSIGNQKSKENSSILNSSKENRKMISGGKVLAMTMCLLLGVMMLAGCSGTSQGSAGKTNSDYKGQTVFGEVTKVSSESITIDVGTSNMPGGGQQGQPPEMPDGQKPDAGNSDDEQSDSSKSDGEQSATSQPDGQKPDGEKPSMIEKTGETATITVDGDTAITKGGMGFMRMPGGAPDGQPPEKPGSDSVSSDSDSTGENASGSENDGNNDTGSSNGDASSSESNGDSSNADKPVTPEGFGQEENIQLSDIKEGDIVAITLDENGKAVSVTVMSSDNFMQGGPGMPGSPEGNAESGNGDSSDGTDATAA